MLGFIVRKEYKECENRIRTAKVKTRAEKSRITENRGYGFGNIVFG